MTRSSKKGPYESQRLLKKLKALEESGGKGKIVKTWERSCTITPEFVGHNIGVYNGRLHVNISCTEGMVGHKLGEFAPTRTFRSHGGKLAKGQK